MELKQSLGLTRVTGFSLKQLENDTGHNWEDYEGRSHFYECRTERKLSSELTSTPPRHCITCVFFSKEENASVC